jgi:hypothetical protein
MTQEQRKKYFKSVDYMSDVHEKVRHLSRGDRVELIRKTNSPYLKKGDIYVLTGPTWGASLAVKNEIGKRMVMSIYDFIPAINL